jgi:hypothetical protein
MGPPFDMHKNTFKLDATSYKVMNSWSEVSARRRLRWHPRPWKRSRCQPDRGACLGPACKHLGRGVAPPARLLLEETASRISALAFARDDWV